jgi:simple sugar transport system permease protein
MQFERRSHIPLYLVLCAPVAAVLASLVLSSALIGLTGTNPLAAYRNIAIYAAGSRLALTETLTRATPLILCGLSVAAAFRARLWNIGVEGQFYAGALAAVAIGSQSGLTLPSVIIIPLLCLVAAAAGFIVLAVPLALRLRFGVDEVVTTLLLNFIVILFVSAMVNGPLKDPLAFGWPQSVPVMPAAMLPKLVARSPLHIGFALALGLALLLWIVERYTVFGLESRAAGFNPEAAAFAGVPIPIILFKVAALSGGLAGLAGGIEVMGGQGYLTTDLSPGYGYTGIVVAMLAGLHPFGVVIAALFIAATYIGADGMSRALNVSSYIADVIVALSLLTMLMAMFLVSYRVRR